MSKGVELGSRSKSTSASKVHSFFAIGFSLSSRFHSWIVLDFFLLFFCLRLAGHYPFSGLCCSRRKEHWSFSFSLCLWLSSLVFSEEKGGEDLDDWPEVRWVAAADDWLAVHWLAGEGDWFEVRWVTGEGDWLEIRWIEGAEFGSSWPKVSVSSSFWVDKIWIHSSRSYFRHRSLLF